MTAPCCRNRWWPISQSLLKRKDGSGRIAAHEIMLGTPAIRNLIRENKIAQMYSVIQTSLGAGMQNPRSVSAGADPPQLITPAEARLNAKQGEMFA